MLQPGDSSILIFNYGQMENMWESGLKESLVGKSVQDD